METRPTVDPAVRALDHVKLSLFVAALGMLAGSLGGRPTAATSCGACSSSTKKPEPPPGLKKRPEAVSAGPDIRYRFS